jgi:hypothetical protein
MFEKSGHRIENFSFAIFVVIILILPGWLKNDLAFADQTLVRTVAQEQSSPAAQSDDGEYHTPLAGEPFYTTFLGQDIYVPGGDRGNRAVLILGGSLSTPKQADTGGTPIFASYLKRMWGDTRLRLLSSGIFNEVDGVKSFGNFEILGRFESDTNPFGQTGIQDNKEIEESSVKWGTLSTFLGVGLRFPVAPYQVDNDLSFQLFGQVGYLYSKPTSDTGPTVKLPPDTILYGVKLRGRYDGFRRNLIELPHSGAAAGFDFDFVHREKWVNFGNHIVTFKKENTQDYLKFSGYVMGVLGVPGLSEKNRLLISLHGGVADKKSIDRFNAFPLGGGPFPDETDRLYSPNYPGVLYDQTLVSKYLLTNLEYRRELLPFIYLHLRGTFIWADRATIIGSNQIGFKSDNGQSASVGLMNGFFWNSRLYLEYAWDFGFLRDGKPGSGFLIFWSKSF